MSVQKPPQIPHRQTQPTTALQRQASTPAPSLHHQRPQGHPTRETATTSHQHQGPPSQGQASQDPKSAHAAPNPPNQQEQQTDQTPEKDPHPVSPPPLTDQPTAELERPEKK